MSHSPGPFTTVLADHLATRRESILGGWRAAVDADPELADSPALDRQAFEDSLPFVLDAFERRLRGNTDGPGDALAPGPSPLPPAEHGPRRWRQGDDLRGVILEWGHLQACLLQELEACRAAATLPGSSSAALTAATAELTRLVNAGIADGAEQYARFQNHDAASRLHDLEEALTSFTNADRHRTEVMRESAHDLRGQLNIIVSATALLDDPTLPGPMREETFDLLKKGVRTLHKMLTEVLDVARLEVGRETRRVEAFDAGELLGGLCADTQRLARERGLRFMVDGPAHVPVEGDRGKVLRIAQNLLVNAIQNTAQGEVTLGWAADDAERWRLRVRDTGPGLPDAARATILAASRGALGARPGSVAAALAASVGEPTPPSSGKGIGLTVVRRLCDLLQARVEVETAPGEGTEIQVLLPRRHRSAEGTRIALSPPGIDR